MKRGEVMSRGPGANVERTSTNGCRFWLHPGLRHETDECNCGMPHRTRRNKTQQSRFCLWDWGASCTVQMTSVATAMLPVTQKECFLPKTFVGLAGATAPKRPTWNLKPTGLWRPSSSSSLVHVPCGSLLCHVQ